MNMKTTVVFEKGMTIAQLTVGHISSESDGVWYIEKKPHGVDIVTHDHGTYLIPWHNVKHIRYN